MAGLVVGELRRAVREVGCHAAHRQTRLEALRQELGATVTLRELFSAPTVEAVARAIAARAADVEEGAL